MGLGKTIQVLGFISRLYEKNIKKPILIVSPLSVVTNWKNEISKFTSFKYQEFIGESKDLFFMNPQNILLCTYDGLRNNINDLAKVNFSVCIFDEAQKIKNFNSKTTIAANKLCSDTKIALTGTPIENNWKELWSIFNLINKSFLEDTYKNFESKYLKEIDENKFECSKALLDKVKPFILSRMKKDVLKELPEKIINSHVSEITEIQKECYKEILRNKKIDILPKFTKLMQITSHPKLYNKVYSKINDSCKMISIKEILNRNSNNNEKIIIFYQYLDIITDFKHLGNDFSFNFNVISGKTKKSERDDIVKYFNNSKNKELLLLSYKTSALGLNINTADIIIHYDRWWNPALEKQAEDRAYRLGRKKPLFIYKLLAEGSLDEKILNLHKDKLNILNSILTKGSSKSLNIIKEILEELENDFK